MEQKTQIKVIKNERGNVTLLVKPVTFYFVDYLYSAFEKNGKKSYFASGVINIPYKELFPHLKDIVEKLNSSRKPQQIEEYDISHIFTTEEDEFALFKPSFDEDGVVRQNQYQISLNGKKAKDYFLSGNPQENKPVPKDVAVEYTYAIEVELVPGYKEEEDENYVYAIFHRAFICGKAQVSTKQDDGAWEGFDLGVSEEDLPF